MPVISALRPGDRRVFMSTACRRFRNAITILNSINEAEFERATGLDGPRWRFFRDNRVASFLLLDTAKAEAVWKLIEARQPKELRSRVE